MSLRRKLFFILSLMTMVPLLVLLFGVVEQFEGDLQSRITAELHGKLDKMTSEVDTLLASQKSLALGLAEVPAVNDFISQSISTADALYEERIQDMQKFFLAYQQRVPAIQALRLIDPSGKTLVKVKEGQPIEPQYLDSKYNRYYVADQSAKPFVKEAVSGLNRLYVSDFERGQVAAEADFCPAMIRYSVPLQVTSDENVDGLLVVNMWGTRIDETVLAAIGGFPGKVYIAEINDNKTRDGIYLFHQDSEQRFSNQLGTSYRFSSDIGEEHWNRIRDDFSGQGQFLLDDGRMYFYKRYEPYEDERSSWVLVIEASHDEVFAPITHLRYSILLMMAVLFVMSLLIARWAASRLARPVQMLAEGITRYADGETQIRCTQTRSDEIGVAARAFNYLCERLERMRSERDKAESAVRQSERLAAVGQMAAGIGHEINNPLMNIMSLASLAEKSIGDDNPEVKQDLKTLQEEGERCARIVQGILKFARASEPSIVRFDLAVMIRDTLSLLKHRLDSAHLLLSTDIEDSLYIKGDSDQLQQVFVNVLLNAIQASPEATEIKVVMKNVNDKVCIEFVDQGKGIPREELSRVFNPFYSTKPEGQGTGLGLSVSYGIVQKHGGSIDIESNEGQGTTVRINLPLDESIQSLDESGGVEELTREKKIAGS